MFQPPSRQGECWLQTEAGARTASSCAERACMDFRDTSEEAAFRAEVRAFIEKELPPELRRREGIWSSFEGGGWGSEAARAWWRKLADRVWVAPAWPKEYGGAGMTVMEQFIFN